MVDIDLQQPSIPALPPTHPNTEPRLPQIISHRGYKGQYPENTLAAVEGAVHAGTHGLELDLHLSSDEVVVLSHDPTLNRCYGVDEKVGQCDWEYMSTLRTTQAPHVPMPRLLDILKYLREPGREKLWVLLDIKMTNDPETIIRRIAETIESVPMPAGGPDWHERIVLGCWSARYLPLRDQYLPRYPIALIAAFLDYARDFLKVPRLSFNLNHQVIMGPLGRGFLRQARDAHRPVFLWTVNAPNLMRWGIRNQVDGIVTDEPALCKRVCEEWKKEQGESTVAPPLTKLDRLTLGQRMAIWAITTLVVLSSWYFRRKYLPSIERVQFEQSRAK